MWLQAEQRGKFTKIPHKDLWWGGRGQKSKRMAEKISNYERLFASDEGSKKVIDMHFKNRWHLVKLPSNCKSYICNDIGRNTHISTVIKVGTLSYQHVVFEMSLETPFLLLSTEYFQLLSGFTRLWGREESLKVESYPFCFFDLQILHQVQIWIRMLRISCNFYLIFNRSVMMLSHHFLFLFLLRSHAARETAKQFLHQRLLLFTFTIFVFLFLLIFPCFWGVFFFSHWILRLVEVFFFWNWIFRVVQNLDFRCRTAFW